MLSAYELEFYLKQNWQQCPHPYSRTKVCFLEIVTFKMEKNMAIFWMYLQVYLEKLTLAMQIARSLLLLVVKLRAIEQLPCQISNLAPLFQLRWQVINMILLIDPVIHFYGASLKITIKILNIAAPHILTMHQNLNDRPCSPRDRILFCYSLTNHNPHKTPPLMYA